MSSTKIIIVLLLTLYSPTSFGAERLAGPIKASVIKVLDGDTLQVKMQVWLNQEIETKVRINGIDTPEIKGKCDFEKNRALEAKAEIAKLIGDKSINLSNIKYGKYAGRVLADITTSSGINIAEHMIEKGFARPYFGEKRQGWCN